MMYFSDTMEYGKEVELYYVQFKAIVFGDL